MAGSPVPLVLTCRPERERGGFTGPEAERMAVLRAAYDAGAAYIDVETDSLDQVAGWDEPGRPGSSPRSTGTTDARRPARHVPGPARPLRRGQAGRHGAAAADVLPVLELLATATTPVIAMAMGGAGTCTRILAPAFPHTVLTYGVGRRGQPDRARPDHRRRDDRPLRPRRRHARPPRSTSTSPRPTAHDQAVLEAQEKAPRGAELHVSLRTSADDAPALAARVADALPGVTVQVER